MSTASTHGMVVLAGSDAPGIQDRDANVVNEIARATSILKTRVERDFGRASLWFGLLLVAPQIIATLVGLIEIPTADPSNIIGTMIHEQQTAMVKELALFAGGIASWTCTSMFLFYVMRGAWRMIR